MHKQYLRAFLDDAGHAYWFGAILMGIAEVVKKRGGFRNMRLSKKKAAALSMAKGLLVPEYGDVGVYVDTNDGGVGVKIDMGLSDVLIGVEDDDGAVIVRFRLRGCHMDQRTLNWKRPDVITEGTRCFTVTNRDKIAAKMGVVPPVVYQILEFVECV